MEREAKPMLWESSASLPLVSAVVRVAFGLAVGPALWLTLLLAPTGAGAADSPFARPDWVSLEDLGYLYPQYASTTPGDWAEDVDADGNVWSYKGCFSPAGVTPPLFSVVSSQLAQQPSMEDGVMLGIQPDYNDPRMIRITRFPCGEPAKELGALSDFLDWPYPPNASINMVTAMPNNEPCMAVEDDVFCFHTASGTIEPWTLFSAAELVEALVPDDPAYRPNPYSTDPEEAKHATWVYTSILPLPDGRVFALLQYAVLVTPGQGSTYSLRWLVERSPSGKLTIRLGPEEQYKSGAIDPPTLASLTRLAYHKATHSVFLWQTPTRLLDQGGGNPVEYHIAGLGVRILPVDASQGEASLDLQQLLMEQPHLPYADLTSFVQGPGGEVFFAFSGPGGGRLLRLKIDIDQADLDRDGLSGAEEADWGTSDFDPDFDGGGIRDGYEVHIAKTDPALASDDEAGRSDTTFGWAYSFLIRMRIPLSELTFQWQQTPLICGSNPQYNVTTTYSCYDAGGKLVVEGLPGPPSPAADGSSLVYSDGTSYRRRTLSDGKEEVLGEVASMRALLAFGSEWESLAPPIVGPAGRVYVPGTNGVLLLGKGPPQVLWTKDSLECDAGLGPCAEEGAPPVLPGLPPEKANEFTVVGYDAAHDRLVAIFLTTLEAYLFTIGMDQPPFIVRQGVDFPHGILMQAVAAGFDYYTAALPTLLLQAPGLGWLASWQVRSSNPFVWGAPPPTMDFANAGFASAGTFQFGYLPGAYSAGWDTSLFLQGSGIGLTEVTRQSYDISPGDALVWNVADDVNPGLMVSGPRGGALQLGVSDLAKVKALGASSDGRICLVTPDNELVLWTKTGEDWLAYDAQFVMAAHDAVDCFFDRDGRLTYLATSPTRIGQLLGETVGEWTIPELTNPRRFTPGTKAGTYRLTGAFPLACYDTSSEKLTSGLFRAAGITTTRGGWLLAITSPDGRLVRVRDDRACQGEPEEIGRPWGDSEAEYELVTANIAERPDGLLLLQRATWSYTSGQAEILPVLEAYDPRTGKHEIAVPLKLAPALAIVPGGTWCDPWEPLVPRPADGCYTMDPLPGSGTPDDGDGGGSGDGGGCSIGIGGPGENNGLGGATPGAPGVAAMVSLALGTLYALRKMRGLRKR